MIKDSHHLRPSVNENAINLPHVNKFNPFDTCLTKQCEWRIMNDCSVLDCRKGGNAWRDHPIRIISTATLVFNKFDTNISKINCKTLNTGWIFEGHVQWLYQRSSYGVTAPCLVGGYMCPSRDFDRIALCDNRTTPVRVKIPLFRSP